MSTYPLTANSIYGSEIYFTKTYKARIGKMANGNGIPALDQISNPNNGYYLGSIPFCIVTSEFYSIHGDYFSVTNNIQLVDPVRDCWERYNINNNPYYRILNNTGHGGGSSDILYKISMKNITKYQRSLQQVVSTTSNANYIKYTRSTYTYGGYATTAFGTAWAQDIVYTMTGSISIDKKGYDKISIYGDDVVRSLRQTSYTTTTRQVAYGAQNNNFPPSSNMFPDAYCEINNFILDAYMYRQPLAYTSSTLIKNGTFTTSDPILAITLPYYSASNAYGSVFYNNVNGQSYRIYPDHFNTDYYGNPARNSMTYTNKVNEFAQYITTGTQTTTYDIIYG